MSNTFSTDKRSVKADNNNEEDLLKRIQTPKKSIKLKSFVEKPNFQKPKVSDYHSPRGSDIGLKLERSDRSRKCMNNFYTAEVMPFKLVDDLEVPQVSIFMHSKLVSSSNTKTNIAQENDRLNSLNKEYDQKLKIITQLQEKINCQELLESQLRQQLIDLSLALM
mmetsp:Transcript_27410/g.24293  ORF Transcript_27410/g.24293 Transcript_27410/m.24293 type:complete len:165 (+) Transcript_27410:370-864(+)